MAIAKKINNYISQSSWIRKMFEEGIRLKQKFGAENVFDFSLGNPNLEPPVLFKEVLQQIASENIPGMHGYMPNAGYEETRTAVADHLTRLHDLPIKAQHIIMTCGAGGALNIILKTLVDPGDEVIIPAPYFVEYGFYVDNAGGSAKFVQTKNDFSLDLEAIKSALTNKTKVVLINSPNNPTGKVYTANDIDGLASLLADATRKFSNGIYLVSDEPYREIVYEKIKVPSVLAAFKNSIIAFSYSKSLSLPGERIGYIAANPDAAGIDEVLGGMILCNRILGFVNAPALMQRVVARLQDATVDVDAYKKKRDLLCDGLVSIGYSFAKPQGAFYLFPQTPIPDDVEFVQALQKRQILTVPGSGFGRPGHIRIAYCVDDETISKSMAGFAEAFNQYHQ